MVISSRTPEGSPGSCPVCGHAVQLEPSDPAGDAPCPRCGHLIWFTWDDRGEARVIRPTGAILRSEELGGLIAGVSWPQGIGLVLDLAEVQYITSAALGQILDLKKQVAAARGRLKLEGLSPELLDVFRITRLDRVLDVGR